MPNSLPVNRHGRPRSRRVFGYVPAIATATVICVVVAVSGGRRRDSPQDTQPIALPSAGTRAFALALGDKATLDQAALTLCRYDDPREVGPWYLVERFRAIAAAVERGDGGVVWPTFGNDVASASARLGFLTEMTCELQVEQAQASLADLSDAFVYLAIAISNGDFPKAIAAYDRFCDDLHRFESTHRHLQPR